jgi:hypothetical protein
LRLNVAAAACHPSEAIGRDARAITRGEIDSEKCHHIVRLFPELERRDFDVLLQPFFEHVLWWIKQMKGAFARFETLVRIATLNVAARLSVRAGC